MSFRSTALDQRVLLAVGVALVLAGCAKKQEEPTLRAPGRSGGPPRHPFPPRTTLSKARSTSSPGPATSSAARPTRPTTGSPGFEQETGCKVNVKTAGTSDEMVALMNQGGYDLVTASGDASLRLIRGGTVQPVDIARIPSYAERRRAAAERPLAHRRRQALRRALPVGPERAHVQHHRLQDRADLLVGGVRGAEAPRRQDQQGPHPGLRRPDLHRRRRAVPDGEAARARHQGPVRAQRRAVRGGARAAPQAAPAGAPLLARRQRADAATSRTRASSPRAPGPSRSTRCSGEQAAGREHHPGRGRHGLGRHHHARTPRPSTRTAPTSGWSGR